MSTDDHGRGYVSAALAFFAWLWLLATLAMLAQITDDVREVRDMLRTQQTCEAAP